MRFVAIKTMDQQAVQVVHRTRELLVGRNAGADALRGHLAEFGGVFPQGAAGLRKAVAGVDRHEG